MTTLKDSADSDELVFAAEEPRDADPTETWKVLIVDDDAEVHHVTRLALGDFRFEDKKLEFVSIYSGEEARTLIADHPDTAVILLDVVMEQENAGLDFVRHLRDELGNRLIRIILRTGQPGQAPEERVIADYDINDYRTKTELTAQKLFNSMIVALRSFRDLMQIEAHKTELQSLVASFERFVPHEFLSHLEKDSIVDVQLGDQVQKEMTILFSDIRDFTPLSEQMTPEENFRFANSFFSRMEPSIGTCNGFIDKFIGDAIMALFPQCPDDALRAAITMLQALKEYNTDRAKVEYAPIRIGIGLNTGALMLGTVGGQNRMDGTVISDAVNVASRVETMTKTYDVPLLLSSNTYEHLADPYQYAIRKVGRVSAKGKSSITTVYEAFDADAPECIELKKQTLADFARGLDLFSARDFQQAHQTFAAILAANPADTVARRYAERSQHLIAQGVADDWSEVESMD